MEHQKNPRFLLWTYLLTSSRTPSGSGTTFIHGNLWPLYPISFFPSFHGKSRAFFLVLLRVFDLWWQLQTFMEGGAVMMWELGKRDYIHIKYSIMCLDRFLSYSRSSCWRRSEKHKGRNLLKRNNSLHTRLKSLVEDGWISWGRNVPRRLGIQPKTFHTYLICNIATKLASRDKNSTIPFLTQTVEGLFPQGTLTLPR